MESLFFISRNEEKFLTSEIGGELVMMHLDTGDYLGLNEVGSDIWRVLEIPKTTDDIVEQLLVMYDIDREQCTRKVSEFIEKMKELDMITIKS